MEHWRTRALKPPGPLDRAARNLQGRVNAIIPEQVHASVTTVISGLTRTILTGSDLVAPPPRVGDEIWDRDARARAIIDSYRKTAAVEGGVAGAGGFVLALADFPALLTIKIKMLFDLCSAYGHSYERFSERLYILALFQLAFSGADHRAQVFHTLEGWDVRAHAADFDQFDWRAFQQEYRDYIDLAKMAQLIPIVGAPIGAVVNWRLLNRLGETAINGYRLRYLER